MGAAAAERLARLHGSEARELARGGTQELVPGVLASEIEFAVRKEGAATLEDLLYRRLRTSLYAGSAREAAVLPAAERMARLLGWDAARTPPRCAARARSSRRTSLSATARLRRRARRGGST